MARTNLRKLILSIWAAWASGSSLLALWQPGSRCGQNGPQKAHFQYLGSLGPDIARMGLLYFCLRPTGQDSTGDRAPASLVLGSWMHIQIWVQTLSTSSSDCAPCEARQVWNKLELRSSSKCLPIRTPEFIRSPGAHSKAYRPGHSVHYCVARLTAAVGRLP